MNAIKIYKCEKDTCYKHQKDNRYLGKFLRTDSRIRDNSAGAAGQTGAPVYVFEKETIEDHYPADMVIPTTCANGGGKRKSRRATKNTRRNRRRNSRRN